MAKPAILWIAMKIASPAEPDTSPKKPVTSSTSSRVSRMLFAQKAFIPYTIQRTGTPCVIPRASQAGADPHVRPPGG